MKKINNHQIDLVLKAIFELNIPVKVYSGIKELFDNLPIELSKVETSQKPEDIKNTDGTK